MARASRAVAAAAAALLLSAASASNATSSTNGGQNIGDIMHKGGGGWSTGRATHYGGGDAIHSSLNTGSCMMKIEGPKYVTAVNCAGSGNTDKCGQCYEVMCVDGPTRGSPGSRFGGGPSACHDPGRKAVVVQVTDSCPCNYPGNAASNAMWCCGDMFHLDLSYTAFDVIADRSKGVVDLVWRQVDCATRKNSVTTY